MPVFLFLLFLSASDPVSTSRLDTQGQYDTLLKSLELKSRSTPKEAISEIDHLLSKIGEEPLVVREKLINLKAFSLMIISEDEQAEKLLQNWLDTMALSHPELTTRAYEILGAISTRQGKHIQAANHIKHALELSDRFQQHERMITSRIYAAIHAINAGQYDAGMELLLYARQLNKIHGNDYLKLNIENNINELLIKLGNFEEALFGFRSLLSTNPLAEDDTTYIHMAIARCLLRLERYAEAKIHANKALAGYQNRYDPFFYSRALITLAEIDLNTKEYRSAESTLERALEISEENNFYEQLSEGYRILSKVHFETSQLERAYQNLEKHIVNLKNYQNDLATTQLTELRGQVDYLQRQHQVDQLQSEVELSKLKSTHQRRVTIILTIAGVIAIIGLLVIVHTQRKKQKQIQSFTNELEASYKTLQQTQQQLVASEKMAATAGMVAGLAHELNTPLGVMTTAMSLVKDKLESFSNSLTTGITKKELENYLESNRQSLNLCETNLERCTRLINTFKQLAISPSDSLTVFSLEDLISQLLKLVETSIYERNISVIQKNTAILLHADKQHFQLLLIELISNSLEHGFVDSYGEEITISVIKMDDYWCLKYEDDGIGISEQAVTSIFDPFYTTHRHDGHLGLGLNRVYNLVTLALNGSLEINKTDRGFSLSCSFPNKWLN